MYTVIWTSDKGRNWEKLPIKEASALIENLQAYGVEDLTILAPDAHTVDIFELESIAFNEGATTEYLNENLSNIVNAVASLEPCPVDHVRVKMHDGEHSLFIYISNDDTGMVCVVETHRLNEDGQWLPMGLPRTSPYGDYIRLLSVCQQMMLENFLFVTLSATPVSDEFYSTEFVVPKEWLKKVVEQEFADSLYEFLATYTWDTSDILLQRASAEGMLVSRAQKM